MNSNVNNSETTFKKRYSLIRRGIQKANDSKSPDERQKASALVSMASATSAIHDESVALRLLKLIDQLL